MTLCCCSEERENISLNFYLPYFEICMHSAVISLSHPLSIYVSCEKLFDPWCSRDRRLQIIMKYRHATQRQWKMFVWLIATTIWDSFLFTHIQSTETTTHDVQHRQKGIFFPAVCRRNHKRKKRATAKVSAKSRCQNIRRNRFVPCAQHMAATICDGLWLQCCICVHRINRGNVQLIKAENTRKTTSISFSSKPASNQTIKFLFTFVFVCTHALQSLPFIHVCFIFGCFRQDSQFVSSFSIQQHYMAFLCNRFGSSMLIKWILGYRRIEWEKVVSFRNYK